MAKDGTFRGGARLGAGQKKKPLYDKLLEGNPGKRPLTIFEFQNTAELSGETMPPPSALLSAEQKGGKKLVAADVYENTWNWLNERKCAHLVTPLLLEQFAMSVARWMQCEESVTEFGFLAKHPTTGSAINSPYVAMSQSYLKQAQALWFQIYQVVRENNASDYKASLPQDDRMERLLNTKRGV